MSRATLLLHATLIAVPAMDQSTIRKKLSVRYIWLISIASPFLLPGTNIDAFSVCFTLIHALLTIQRSRQVSGG
jgi:hypothetical protein